MGKVATTKDAVAAKAAGDLGTVTPQEFRRRADERYGAAAADYDAPLNWQMVAGSAIEHVSVVAEQLSRRFPDLLFTVVFDEGRKSLKASPRAVTTPASDMSEKAAEAALRRYPARASVEAFASGYTEGFLAGRGSNAEELRELRARLREAERPPHPMSMMGPRYW